MADNRQQQEGVKDPQIRAAIKEALGTSGYSNSIDESMDDLHTLVPPAQGPAGAGDVDSGALPDEGEADSEGEATEPAPTSYWGISLEGIPDEQRRDIIARLEQQDGYIQKLQQRLAQEPERREPESQEPAPEATDEDILRALGVDPEGDEAEVEYARKFSLPLAKQVMQLEQTVEQLQDVQTAQSAATWWNSELDRLEREYGALPFERIKVLQYAADEGIGDPEVVYFRLTAPVRKQLDSELARLRQSSLKREAAGGVRPRSTTQGAKSLDTEGKSLRDVVRDAAIAAQEETGKRWVDILRRH